MKTLNETLREEFDDILKKEEYKIIVEDNNLDLIVLRQAFEILLKHKSNAELIDSSKTEFENYLINYFKNPKNDN
jgi:hypothetical protein